MLAQKTQKTLVNLTKVCDFLPIYTPNVNGLWKKKSKHRCCVFKTNKAEICNQNVFSAFQADEPAPVGNYDQRKQEEETRLQIVLERLNALIVELSPPGPSSAAGSVQ